LHLPEADRQRSEIQSRRDRRANRRDAERTGALAAGDADQELSLAVRAARDHWFGRCDEARHHRDHLAGWIEAEDHRYRDRHDHDDRAAEAMMRAFIPAVLLSCVALTG